MPPADLPRKNMLGQKDSARIRHAGHDGGPIKTECNFAALRNLSTEDKFALREILLRASAANSDDGGDDDAGR
jgi:hypothetical protein